MFKDKEQIKNFIINDVVLANIADVIFHTLKDINKKELDENTIDTDMLDQKLVRTLIIARLNQKLSEV